MSAEKPIAILRFKHLKQRTNLSRSTIYAKMAAGDFPRPLSLGPRAIGWLEADIEAWILALSERSLGRFIIRKEYQLPSRPESQKSHE
ncbi:MAG: AlpA family transcriptional regulator [Nitrospira sp.]|jgi:prophage regulatory protein|nr:AlpA family transcriptional regulator [Nitrospira sp.]